MIFVFFSLLILVLAAAVLVLESPLVNFTTAATTMTTPSTTAGTFSLFLTYPKTKKQNACVRPGPFTAALPLTSDILMSQRLCLFLVA